MLLHVFHVDTGTMVKFDVGLALDTVSNLNIEIERKCGIPCEKQVLLASGGQTLESSERVGTYYAGTDTSPIFLFSKLAIENQIPPEPYVDYGPDPDMKAEVSGALNLAATINTVRVRSLLAQRLCDLAGEQLRILDNLVHDQHLQQQGWAAVIANLDDITSLFRSRSECFDHNFKQHLQSREQYIEILESFQCDIETLNKIPVLPALLEAELANASSDVDSVGSKSGSGSGSTDIRAGGDSILDSGTVSLPFDCPSSNSDGQVTLLQWIANKDKQASLQQLAEQCKKGISQFDDKAVETLMAEVEAALTAATAADMREIKGLEDRLFGLENLRHEANNIVKEQSDLTNSFIQNENSVSNLGGDESILPDLCMSHRQQLVVMLKNHLQLRDIRHRCVRAKKELATNLFLRLRWVMFVQRKILETDGRLAMHHENVKKLRRYLEVLQQVHTAPTVYLNAVTEVVRRRAFSQAFLMWGNEVSSQVSSVHSEEVERRKEFQSKFQGHFLSSLFPGLDDIPPSFATHPPPLFDSNLPKLSVEDIEALRNQLPDLARSLSVPDLASVTQFFLSISKADLNTHVTSRTQTSSNEKIQVEVVGGTQLDGTLLQPTDNSQSSAQSATQPISDRGFESETDTEDLENITTSHEVPLLKNGRKRKEGCIPNDGEEAKKAVAWLSAAGDSVLRLKADVAHLRDWVLCQKSDLHDMFAALSMQNHHLTKEVEGKCDEIRCLEGRISELEVALRTAQRDRDSSDHAAALEAARREGEAAASDHLTRTHRAELEAVRLRYRMMISSQALERSTSESSLQSCPERGDYIERSEYEALLAQVRQEMQQEKENAIQQLNAQWEERIAQDELLCDQRAQSLANDLIKRNNEKLTHMNELKARMEMESSRSGTCISCGSSMMTAYSTMSGSMGGSSTADSGRPQSPPSSLGSSSVAIMSTSQPTESSTKSQVGTGSAESSPRASSRSNVKLVN